MKEYVCKDDMIKAIKRIIDECGLDDTKRNGVIDEMLILPTVTKTDICREFAELLYICLPRILELKDNKRFNTHKIIDIVLEEMEQ